MSIRSKEVFIINISIIKAAPEHAEEISRICSVGWRQTVQGKYSEAYQEENVKHWYNVERVREDIEKGVYTHVALADGKVAGTIGGILTEEGTSEIYVFYMDEKYRYQGIGSKLLDQFTEEHINNGATDQYASVEKDNELGIPFYTSRGFQQHELNNRYWRKII